MAIKKSDLMLHPTGPILHYYMILMANDRYNQPLFLGLEIKYIIWKWIESEYRIQLTKLVDNKKRQRQKGK